jgi:hypothetical protein
VFGRVIVEWRSRFEDGDLDGNHFGWPVQDDWDQWLVNLSQAWDPKVQFRFKDVNMSMCPTLNGAEEETIAYFKADRLSLVEQVCCARAES